jgi:thiamine biosynthesis protein ThiC
VINVSGEIYKRVNIDEYLKKELDKGRINLIYVQKIKPIFARPGIPGEIIKTKTNNGITESRNTVDVDENGQPEWVITNSTMEQYAVPIKKLYSNYYQDLSRKNMFIPKGVPIIAAQVFENLVFKHNDMDMFLKSEGYIMINSYDDIYAIQKEVFNETYKVFEIPSDFICEKTK